MSAQPQFVGTATVSERLASPDVLWKAIARRISYSLRCGLPGVITAFNPVTQYVSVQLLITEKIFINQEMTQKSIPVLNDVLLLLPGDTNWCITFPSLIGAECYVCFADMCINAWATNGPGAAPNQAQNQEINRRHDLSDGFAILRPRSKPNAITEYSTTAMEIRSADNTVKIALTESEISCTTPLLTVDAPMNVNGKVTVTDELLANSLGTTQTPVASTTSSDHSVPIALNGVTYYIRLSVTP
jgi:hypothetical protein